MAASMDPTGWEFQATKTEVNFLMEMLPKSLAWNNVA